MLEDENGKWKKCLSFTAQHNVEYLKFKYFMPHASQLHLQFHVIRARTSRQRCIIFTLPFVHCKVSPGLE